MDRVYAAIGGEKCGRANEASRDSGGYQGAVGWKTEIGRGVGGGQQRQQRSPSPAS